MSFSLFLGISPLLEAKSTCSANSKQWISLSPNFYSSLVNSIKIWEAVFYGIIDIFDPSSSPFFFLAQQQNHILNNWDFFYLIFIYKISNLIIRMWVPTIKINEIGVLGFWGRRRELLGEGGGGAATSPPVGA